MLSRRTLLTAGFPAILKAASSRPPNLVVVLADDLGYGDLSCFGHPTIRTPELDRFAKEGVRFTDCYASAPVCSPSRAGMLTGRTPDRVGVYDWIPPGASMHMRKSEVTFAHLLQQAGYATCHSGKWHLNGIFNNPAHPQPGDFGFDHWFSTHNNAAPTHLDPVNFIRNGSAVGPLKGNSSTLIVDEALRWLKTLPKEKPFCLFVCFHAPHEPVASDQEFVGMYSQANPDQSQYFASVSELDHNFGRLRTAAGDDAFVMFTSDNGPETLNRYKGAARSYGSPGPLRGMKLHLYEGGYRVPGIVRWPRAMHQGLVSHEPVSNVDVLPTLCSLAGLSTPKVDGSSLLPALTGKPLRRDVPLHWHYFNAMSDPVATLRDGDWKVLGIDSKRDTRQPGAAWKPESMAKVKNISLDRFELYNLKQDPAEKKDLAEREPGRLKALSDRLLKLQKEVQAEGPTW